MAQLTIFKPDNSCADIIDVSDSLYKALFKFSQLFELEHLNLDALKKIKGHALLVVSQNKNRTNFREIQKMASNSLDCFDELIDVIVRLENLEDPDSLCIYLSDY